LSKEELTGEELLALATAYARSWLAHDGLWFLAVESELGTEKAIELDRKAWADFAVIEAKRIMQARGIEPGGGLKALEEVLDHRMYAFVNEYESLWEDGTLMHRMIDCRVQSARRRKNLPDFPCKSVGIVEFGGIAKTVDERIKTECIACPPDRHPTEKFCAWRFTMKK